MEYCYHPNMLFFDQSENIFSLLFFFFFFLLGEGWREGERLWERNMGCLASWMQPDQGSNLQPWYVPWLGIEALIFGLLHPSEPHQPGHYPNNFSVYNSVVSSTFTLLCTHSPDLFYLGYGKCVLIKKYLHIFYIPLVPVNYHLSYISMNLTSPGT